ncbi:uncharacterized protein K489DRAFT_126006 [Dissoconium aciculare CBS 342.82]|uniref:Uncharacterized protein n=1 Tax=Dissoconium aciculare CBS 342.82 TaxID=1314786 RepID=A0A6J3MG23_9PEZI|nr:uncharacterized protein K489DRAFT_126006 [Dissoconium aciculare CBS 342.82]KAF1826813.1 hypothetical protein K489DRAFT_126006 [Dissoconium aciculare CBS 342.82]
MKAMTTTMAPSPYEATTPSIHSSKKYGPSSLRRVRFTTATSHPSSTSPHNLHRQQPPVTISSYYPSAEDPTDHRYSSHHHRSSIVEPHQPLPHCHYKQQPQQHPPTRHVSSSSTSSKASSRSTRSSTSTSNSTSTTDPTAAAPTCVCQCGNFFCFGGTRCHTNTRTTQSHQQETAKFPTRARMSPHRTHRNSYMPPPPPTTTTPAMFPPVDHLFTPEDYYRRTG